jgi:hypothetical protein
MFSIMTGLGLISNGEFCWELFGIKPQEIREAVTNIRRTWFLSQGLALFFVEVVIDIERFIDKGDTTLREVIIRL